jgi:catechol 2,3-dioxygenase-like lactoylglutathione lyase family enzyme
VTPDELATLALLRRARDVLDRDYARPLTVAELARAAFMSPGHFSRQFRAAYGEAPYSCLMTRRIERAKALLRGNFRWLTVGAPSQPDVSVVVTNYLNGTPADNDAVAALLAKGALNGVHFYADDLDTAFGKIRASGADIVQEPTDQPWGARDCAVRDPSGNLVRIDQRPTAE